MKSRTIASLLLASLVFAGVLLADEAPKVVPAATFVKIDDKTSGTWKGVYGAEGFTLAVESAKLPAYAAAVSPTGHQEYTWADTTDDDRGLTKSPVDSKDRLAACWFSADPFDIDINLTDANVHQVAVYCVDWDSEGREQTIEVQNADTGAKLDSQQVAAFHGGKYIIWNLKGHVKLHITSTGQLNAVVSGIFFDAVAKPAK